MDGSTPNDDAAARQLGWEAGGTEKRSGGDCPYAHSVFGLRFAWFDGFSKGRAEMQKAMGTEPATHVRNPR